jgi:alcohol dehydrogenase, propanol-preferring
VRAVQIVKWQSDPEIREVPEPEAGPGQVVIKVGAAGACHSDLHVLYDYPEGAVPYELPFTLGHENAGWVHQLGAGVQGLVVGQPVAVYGPWGCGRCRMCSAGVEIYCEDPANAFVASGGGGLGMNGGYAPYMLVPDARFLVPLPDGLEPLQAAPLTDAALTPYHAVKRSLPKLVAGSNTVVIGVGGLGHLGVQILKALSSTNVIAVDVKDNALELARASGADVTIRSGEDAAEEVRDATGGRGAELVLDFVAAEQTLALAQKSVRLLGDLTIVGAGHGTLPVGFYTQPYEVSVQSVCWGSRPELAEVFQLALRGQVRPEVTTFALDDVLDAYRQMQDGTLKGRAVIVPDEG